MAPRSYPGRAPADTSPIPKLAVKKHHRLVSRRTVKQKTQNMAAQPLTVELHFHILIPQRLREILRVLNGDQRIPGAVEQENGGAPS